MNTSEDDERAREAARVERIYGRYARSARKRRAWAADNPGNLALRDELLATVRRVAAAALAATDERPILDAGCGTGWWLEALSREGVDPSRLAGVDVQADRVERARTRLPGVRLATGDVRRLAFEDDSFGLVLAFTLLSSLDGSASVRTALSELVRVTAADGLLLLYEPRLPNPFERRRRTVSNADLDAAGLDRRQELRLTLLPPLARRLGRSTGWAYPLLLRLRPLRSHRLVVYRKPAGLGDPSLGV